MTNRIDHAAEAHRLIELASIQPDVDSASAVAQAAQVHAQLALVEQQQIANLIALSQAQDGNGWLAQEPLEAIFGYEHPDPGDGFEGLHIRPDIAAALGIEVRE